MEARLPVSGTLCYEPNALLVVGGVPGAGKTTLVRRLRVHPRVVVCDPEDLRDRAAALLGGGVPYRAYRPLIHVLHQLKVVGSVLGRSRPVMVQDCSTRPLPRRWLTMLARLARRPCHLVLLDVPPPVALQGQVERGRVLPARAMARHVAGWHRLSDRGPGRAVAGEGFASTLVLTRADADKLTAVAFAPC